MWRAGSPSSTTMYESVCMIPCRHDHQCKQTPGWTLTTPSPGTLTWTTPGNRSYTTTPAQYPE